MWVKKEELDKLKDHIDALNVALEAASDKSILMDITTEGKKLKFLFLRGEKIFEIETMRLMSDNVKQWKDDLLR